MDITTTTVGGTVTEATATASTGHTLRVHETATGWTVEIGGDESTAGSVPESEVRDVCAAAGVYCTWEADSTTSYRCEAS